MNIYKRRYPSSKSFPRPPMPSSSLDYMLGIKEIKVGPERKGKEARKGIE